MADNEESASILPQRVTGERIIDATETRNVLEKKQIGSLKKASTTPSVSNLETWKTINTGAVTVTNFTNGAPGQHLYIRGEGQTTIQNGAKIKTNTGANKLLAANKFYHLIMYDDRIWYEQA